MRAIRASSPDKQEIKRLLHDKCVGKATLHADYAPVAIMEIEL